MKQPFRGFGMSIVNKLIFFLVAFFVLQSLETLFFQSEFLVMTFALSLESITSGMVWSPFSYITLHDGPLHLVFNLIGLHFIARYVEQDLGPSGFIWLCLSSSLIGGLLWLTFNMVGQLIGVSAIVMSCLSFFCLTRPNQPISFLLFFVLPIRLKPKVILWGILGLELYGFLFSELPSNGSIAHSAHLGGMLAGALMFWLRRNGRELPTFKIKFGSNDSIGTKSKKRNSRFSQANFRVDTSNYSSLQFEVDRILDKINDKGFGSLTEKEKETLEKAKSFLHKN